jgi:hypothetical protein
MATPKQSLIIEQFMNPKQDTSKPETDENYPWVYYVVQVNNRVTPAAGTHINVTQLKELISNGVDCKITRPHPTRSRS